MKKLTNKEREKVFKRLAQIKDEDIDTSDVPELTEEQLRTGVRGLMYRPVKRPVTIRLDADIVEWLKAEGPGYQTKANRLLRFEMLKAFMEKKPAQSAATGSGKKRKKSGT